MRVNYSETQQILVSVVDRLKYLSAAYIELGSAVEQLSKTFLNWALASLERNKKRAIQILYNLDAA